MAYRDAEAEGEADRRNDAERRLVADAFAAEEEIC